MEPATCECQGLNGPGALEARVGAVIDFVIMSNKAAQMNRRNHLRRVLYAVPVVLLLTGCTSPTGERPRFPKLGDLTAAVTELFESDPRSKSSPTAAALYKDGSDYFERGRYARSISFFQKLRDEYPFSEEAEAAELKIAEAYYLNEEYIQADETYKNYLTFQPTGRHTHYVKYQLGRVNLAQFTGIDRDLEKVKEARGYFKSVVQDHPESEHVPDARKRLAETRVHLAERELYVGNHYLKEEQYWAARERFENVLRDYGDTPTAPKARAALARIEALEKAAPEGQVVPDRQADVKAPAQESGTPEPARFITKQGYEYEDAVRKSWYSFLNPFSRGGDTKEEPVKTAATQPDATGEAPAPDGATVAAEGTAAAEATAPAKKKRGFFSFLNPFASSEEKAEEPAKAAPAETASAKAVVEKVDEALGTQGSSKDDAPKPPVSNLPPEEKESGPTPDDPAAVLGDIDARLGGETARAGTPRAPAADPSLFSAKKPKPAKERAAEPTGSGLLEGIDRQLKREGIDTRKELPPPAASP